MSNDSQGLYTQVDRLKDKGSRVSILKSAPLLPSNHTSQIPSKVGDGHTAKQKESNVMRFNIGMEPSGLS